MTTLNLDYLKTEDSNLYAIASKASGQTTGQVELSMEQIKVAAVQLKIAEAEPQISMAELDNEFKRELQTKANEQAARNRLNEWAIAGLQDTQNNADLISAWLRQNQKFSAAGVDEAIASLGPKLTWTLKTAAPKAPQLAATGEVLGLLPNGEKQLPLDVSNYDLKRASKAQAKDWLSRQQAAKPPAHNAVRFGSRF